MGGPAVKPRRKLTVKPILSAVLRIVGPCPRPTETAAAWRSALKSCVCSDAPSPLPFTRVPSPPRTSRTASGSPNRSTRQPTKAPVSAPSCWPTSLATGPPCPAPPPAIWNCSTRRWRRATSPAPTTSPPCAPCAPTPPPPPSSNAAARSPSATCGPDSRAGHRHRRARKRASHSPVSRPPVPGCSPCPGASPPPGSRRPTPAPGEPPAPPRPMPTPAEVFPPKRRPAPPAAPPQELAVG